MTTVSLPARSGHAPSPQDPRHRAAPLPEVESVRLLQGQRELVIRHGNECYRLRHTRNDKLILTK